MEKVAFLARGPDKARGAIVLLPGFGDRPETFEKYGFVKEVLQGAPGYDVFGADAHFGYYRNRNLLIARARRVIARRDRPLVKQGYRELWLMGASMGGHGAVAYARAHPEKIAGVMLFAPYMGPGEVVDEVKRAGGLCAVSSTCLRGQPRRLCARELRLAQAGCMRFEGAPDLACRGRPRRFARGRSRARRGATRRARFDSAGRTRVEGVDAGRGKLTARAFAQ